MYKMTASEKRMTSFPFLTLCLLSLAHATAGLRSSGHLMMFALPGDDVTLPCGIPSVKSCSSISWSMTEVFDTVSEVVKAGRVMPPNVPRLSLLKDCSLNIRRLMLNDARVYSCDSGALNSSVSIHILELAESSPSSDNTVELHCYLNTYKGHRACYNRSIRITWSTEDNAPLNGGRFRFENPSKCFSKLFIHIKLTDHHRKWKCNLLQNDTVRATVSYTTTVKDGVEEVFAAVGETVSLSCYNASFVGVGGAVQWALGGRTLPDEVSLFKGQTGTLSPLVIGTASAEHAGDYQCTESTAQQKVLNKIRLHTVDITSESGGGNLTLTCVLTCRRQCDKDLSLTWSRSINGSWQSGLMTDKETLRNRLVLPAPAVVPDELACLVLREGGVVALKKWSTINSLQTPAWLALPLGLVICFVAGGLYMKQKHSEEAGRNEQSSLRMNKIYGVVPDAGNEDLQPQRQCKREAANADSFYDLLQAVN